GRTAPTRGRGERYVINRLPQVTVDLPDAGGTFNQLIQQPWFYPALASVIVTPLVLLLWRQIPASLKWLALGVGLAALVFIYVIEGSTAGSRAGGPEIARGGRDVGKKNGITSKLAVPVAAIVFAAVMFFALVAAGVICPAARSGGPHSTARRPAAHRD